MLRPLPSETSIYILRHATPERTDAPNRERPLSELGRAQAKALVPVLSQLDIGSIYISPFLRTRQTVSPFAASAGIEICEREDLRESTSDESIPDVRDRLIGAIDQILAGHPQENGLICTHGGCTWATIYQFNSSFDYEDYKTIRTPDLFRIAVSDGRMTLDTTFTFDLGNGH